MRLFAAFPLKKKDREKIYHSINEVRGQFSDLKWVEKENLHITVKFYGDIENPEYIYSELEPLCDRISTFQLVTQGIGEFNRKTFYIKCDIPRDVSSQIRTIDPRFLPHITILRKRKKDKDLKISSVYDLLRSTDFNLVTDISSLNLYKSILNPDGPDYRIMKSYII